MLRKTLAVGALTVAAATASMRPQRNAAENRYATGLNRASQRKLQ